MGWRNRRVASTSMNRESSRSHAVFTMTLESKETVNEVVNIRMSQLNLVDLAGSERQKDTHTEGSRLKVKLCAWMPLHCCTTFAFWAITAAFCTALLSGGQQHQSLPHVPWPSDHGTGGCVQWEEPPHLLQGFKAHFSSQGKCRCYAYPGAFLWCRAVREGQSLLQGSQANCRSGATYSPIWSQVGQTSNNIFFLTFMNKYDSCYQPIGMQQCCTVGRKQNKQNKWK